MDQEGQRARQIWTERHKAIGRYRQRGTGRDTHTQGDRDIMGREGQGDMQMWTERHRDTQHYRQRERDVHAQ